MKIKPEESYLSSRYVDPRGQRDNRQVFHEDGRVMAHEGKESWLICRFTPGQVERAKKAIKDSGLITAKDLNVKGIHDTASVTYDWKIGERSGRVTNRVHPAEIHPVFKSLEEKLDVLEAEAGAEWSRLIDELPEE